MKRLFVLLLSWSMASSCHPSVDASSAFNVAGSYELIDYTSSTTSDLNPAGNITVIQLDMQHVSLVARGMSGKVKINYSYTNILVTAIGQTSQDQDNYHLLYKGRLIGQASNDGTTRYLTLVPTATISLKSAEL